MGQTDGIYKHEINFCYILNDIPIMPSKTLLKSPSGEGNNFYQA